MYERLWRRIAPRKMEENTKENWDIAYKSGYWDRLHAISEVPHTAVVAGYFRSIANSKDASVLDVGCGEGLLLNYLNIEQGQRYLGVDISEIAIERAASRTSDNTHFKIMNIEDAQIDDRYSVIILNECICYFKNLEEVMRMLIGRVRENGHIIVSLYMSPQTKKAWRTLASEMKTVDLVDLRSITGSKWRVGLFRCGREN